MTALPIENGEPVSLDKKLNLIYGLTKSKISSKKTDSIRKEFYELLEKLDNPHLSLPPVIHVAGTNGKGSVIAFLKAILSQAGYSVHAFTSPHLIKFNERYIISNTEITDDKLEKIIDEIISCYDISNLTFFEVSTAIAFLAFSRQKADVVLLETGVGGKYDCTNVINHPVLSLITSISYDHTEFLGESIHEIAGEKAGIIKPNAPCLLSPQRFTETCEQIKNNAQKKNSPLWMEGDKWKLCSDNGLIYVETNESSLGPYELKSLVGEHQLMNAGTAIMALHILKQLFSVTEKNIQDGLNFVQWPARLQNVLKDSSLEVWIDGGHNIDAGACLAKQAKKWDETSDYKLHIILSMMSRKDPKAFLEPMLPYVQSVTLLSLQKHYADSLSNQQCFEIIKGFNIKNLYLEDDLNKAINNICHKYRDQKNRVLITGSLYLAGYALQHLDSKYKTL
jgi:dihydrofolate synthase/folylpolyglutamate synthase